MRMSTQGTTLGRIFTYCKLTFCWSLLIWVWTSLRPLPCLLPNDTYWRAYVEQQTVLLVPKDHLRHLTKALESLSAEKWINEVDKEDGLRSFRLRVVSPTYVLGQFPNCFRLISGCKNEVQCIYMRIALLSIRAERTKHIHTQRSFRFVAERH